MDLPTPDQGRTSQALDRSQNRPIAFFERTVRLVFRHTGKVPGCAAPPEGCDTFYALAPVPHLDADVDWPTYAETFKERICARLEETMLPGLRDRIVTSRLLTPQDFHDRLNSVKGAAFGYEPRITQSAWFRPHNRSEDIEGLYLVGAGTHPGAGMPAVISSAKVIDQLIPEAVTQRA